MSYRLLRRIYEGVDGTNISEFRCDQYLLLMNMCEALGNISVKYTDIQKEAERVQLFGPQTQAKNAVRTICPILNKYGFVREYQRVSFPANEFFTPTGKMFVKVLNALQKTKRLDFQNPTLEGKITEIKTKTIQLGILNMAQNQPNHKIWLLIYALRMLGYFQNNIYYYMLKAIQEEWPVQDAIEAVEVEPTIADDDYLREDGEPMDSTNFGFLVANLKDAGLIKDSTDKGFIPSKYFDEFFKQLKATKYIVPNTYLSLIYECN